MGSYEFIQENSRLSKLWTLFVSLFLLSLLLVASIFFSGFFYKVLLSIPFAGKIINSIQGNIVNTTLSGLFYAHLLGGIFFVPSPDEVIFYYGLLKGNLYYLAYISAIFGYMLAQGINYFLGSKISPVIMHIVSKKKMYKARRFVNKYGSFGIFLFNFLPFPAPMLTFALGIAKYNPTRLFVLTFLGKSCKYIVVIAAYFLFSA